MTRMDRLPPKIAARQRKGRPAPPVNMPANMPADLDGAVVITLPRPPAPPLSMNSAIGMHWKTYTENADPWRDEFATLAKQHRRAVRAMGLPVTVELTLRFARNIRRDPANFYPCEKSAIDGLVIAGCLDDDSPAYVRKLEPIVLIDRHDQSVTLIIRPAKS